MNNPRAATIVFAILDLILVAVFGFMYLSKDRVPPVIQFQPTELTYMASTLNDELLSGAHAVDSKDGDVSDRVVIEKIVLNKTTQNAVVYYAASDYDGNVGKSSRTFPASPALFTQATTLDAQEEMTEGTTGTGTGVMMTQGAGNMTPPVSVEEGNAQEEGQEQSPAQGQETTAGQGPLMQNAGGGQNREIIGALD